MLPALNVGIAYTLPLYGMVTCWSPCHCKGNEQLVTESMSLGLLLIAGNPEANHKCTQ